MTHEQIAELIRDHCEQFADRFCREGDQIIAPDRELPFWIKTLTPGAGHVYVRLECPTIGRSYGPIEVDPCPDAAEFGRTVGQAVETLQVAHAAGVADAMAAMRDTSWSQV